MIATKMKEKKWEMQYKKYCKDKTAWEVIQCVYQLILLHCHPNVKDKFMDFNTKDDVNRKKSPADLLQAIRTIAHKHDEMKGGAMALVEQELRMYVFCYNKRHQVLPDYCSRQSVKSLIFVVGELGFILDCNI